MSFERSLLLVEDDETTREVLLLLLASEGWQVRSAENGEAALALLNAGTALPRVILCDLHLPGVQGEALAQALRALAPEAALLAMSASEPGQGTAGYDALLRKPFGPAELDAMLQHLSPTAAANQFGTLQTQLPVLALETFRKLEAQMGQRAKDLYAFAVADATDRLGRMEAATSDAAAFGREAHALKGSAGMLGAQRLAVLAAEAEKSAPGVTFASRQEHVRQMRLACEEIRLMLKTLLPL